MSVDHSTRSGGMIGYLFDFFNMKVCCVFSLESPYQYRIFNIFHFQYLKKKITLNYPKSVEMGFFPRDSRTNLKQPW